MNNLENNLKNIRINKMTEAENQELWHKIIVSKLNHKNLNRSSINFLELINMPKTALWSLVVLLFILSGGGVVAASGKSGPGDLLFGIDKSIEKIQLNLAGTNKKTALKLKFAEERISEIKKFSKTKDIYTAPENLSTTSVNLNKKENTDVSESLNEIENILYEDIDENKKTRIESDLQEILVLLGDNADLEIKRNNHKIEIESKEDNLKVKIKTDKENKGSSQPTDANNPQDFHNIDDSKDDNKMIDIEDTNDAKEKEEEMFCKGEWRDVKDCDDEEENYDLNEDYDEYLNGNSDDDSKESDDD